MGKEGLPVPALLGSHLRQEEAGVEAASDQDAMGPHADALGDIDSLQRGEDGNLDVDARPLCPCDRRKSRVFERAGNRDLLDGWRSAFADEIRPMHPRRRPFRCQGDKRAAVDHERGRDGGG